MKPVTLPKLLKKAQEAVNKRVRERDSEDGFFTCISCKRVLPVDQMNAGHFVPVKNSSYLRFNQFNINGECVRCNCFDEFHLVGYRKNLIEKIGIDMVKWLEDNSRRLHKWSKDEIQRVINQSTI